MQNPAPAIISGNAHLQLAADITLILNGISPTVMPIKTTVTAFPDGETQVTIHENVRGRQVFVVQPTCAPANHNIMELCILTDALRRASAKEIIAVIPYYGYARQDRKDRSRAPISAKLVANMLVTAGITRVVTIDLHASQVQGFFDIPVDHLYASTLFIQDIRALNLPDLTFLAPDEGGLKRASYFQEAFKLPDDPAFISKRRTGAETVEAIGGSGVLAGKNVVILDDLTESAGTILQAAKIAHEKGAKSVRAYVTHGVLTAKGYERLTNDTSLTELIVTDTTPVTPHPKIRVISMATVLARAIMRIHSNESVSELFQI